MNYNEVLQKAPFSPSLAGETKEEIIAEMIDMLVKAGHISDRDAALKAILEREQKMSTGMQNGIAIPHGKTDALGDMVAAIALKKEGIDFGALDGEPSRIFIMTLSNSAESGPHIQFLAEISKALNSEKAREQLLEATSSEEAARLLA